MKIVTLYNKVEILIVSDILIIHITIVITHTYNIYMLDIQSTYNRRTMNI